MCYPAYEIGESRSIGSSVYHCFIIYSNPLAGTVKGGHPFAKCEHICVIRDRGKTTRHSAVGNSQLHAKNKPKKTSP